MCRITLSIESASSFFPGGWTPASQPCYYTTTAAATHFAAFVSYTWADGRWNRWLCLMGFYNFHKAILAHFLSTIASQFMLPTGIVPWRIAVAPAGGALFISL